MALYVNVNLLVGLLISRSTILIQIQTTGLAAMKFCTNICTPLRVNCVTWTAHLTPSSGLNVTLDLTYLTKYLQKLMTFPLAS